MKIPNRLFLIAPMLFAVPTAFAQPRVLQVDPDASAVAFSLADVLHSVHGDFHVRSGSVIFDPAGSKVSGSVTVAAGSGKSGNDTRDKKMSNEILDASHFADVTFVPTSYQGVIKPTGDSSIQVIGTFTLHGTAHELTVPMQVHIEGSTCTAKTHFSIPYVKWGLKDPSTFVLRVGKEVQIDLILVGHLTSAS